MTLSRRHLISASAAGLAFSGLAASLTGKPPRRPA